MTAILYKLAIGLALVAFAVAAISSSLAGASLMSVITRGVVAFVVFGVFGIIGLRGLVSRVIGDLARHAEETGRQDEAAARAAHEGEAGSPRTEQGGEQGAATR